MKKVFTYNGKPIDASSKEGAIKKVLALTMAERRKKLKQQDKARKTQAVKAKNIIKKFLNSKVLSCELAAPSYSVPAYKLRIFYKPNSIFKEVMYENEKFGSSFVNSDYCVAKIGYEVNSKHKPTYITFDSLLRDKPIKHKVANFNLVNNINGWKELPKYLKELSDLWKELDKDNKKMLDTLQSLEDNRVIRLNSAKMKQYKTMRNIEENKDNPILTELTKELKKLGLKRDLMGFTKGSKELAIKEVSDAYVYLRAKDGDGFKISSVQKVPKIVNEIKEEYLGG